MCGATRLRLLAGGGAGLCGSGLSRALRWLRNAGLPRLKPLPRGLGLSAV
jgi:hypothetical protein